MSEIFRKGQIVPKRLGHILFSDRKARHCVVFGCDVEVSGHIFTALTDGPILYVYGANGPGRHMRNGSFKKSNLTVKDILFRGQTLAHNQE